jgi:hypothetical protein
VKDPPTVSAIISRDHDGKWRRTAAAQLDTGEQTLLLPTGNGVVLVVGEVGEADRAAISSLLKEIDCGPQGDA